MKAKWIKIKKSELEALRSKANERNYYSEYREMKEKVEVLQAELNGRAWGHQQIETREKEIIRSLMLIIGGYCPKNPFNERTEVEQEIRRYR